MYYKNNIPHVKTTMLLVNYRQILYGLIFLYRTIIQRKTWGRYNYNIV